MTSPTKLWYLENLQVLHTLSGPEKQHLHEQTRMQTFARGETIYFAGDPADSLYVLKTGQVKISYRPAIGQEVMLALLGPGDLFGELTPAADAPSLVACGEEAVALQEALVCQLAAADFQALLKANHQFTLEINKLVGQRLQRVQHRLSALVFKTAEERIRDLLRELGQAYGSCVANDPSQVVVKLQLTHHDLARLAATSRQTVTTLLGSLAREGILTHNRRHLFIKRLDAL
jgi:CRP/FNR family cyclic AMP-dependent transcriptional regulator